MDDFIGLEPGTVIQKTHHVTEDLMDSRPKKKTKFKPVADVTGPVSWTQPDVSSGTILSNVYSLPLDRLNSDALADIKKKLERTPITKAEAYTGKTPDPLILWSEDQGRLIMPRYFGVENFGTPESDLRSLGQDLLSSEPFRGKLKESNPPQVQAVATVMDRMKSPGGALLSLDVGMGKTVCALYILRQLGRKTAVLCGNAIVMGTWTEKLGMFLPDLTTGTIKGRKVDVEGKDVVICSIQSLMKKEYPPELMAQFGFVIVDECHHIGAKEFVKSLRQFTARYTLGLSATPIRNDGLTDVVYWNCGPLCYVARRTEEDADVTVLVYTEGAEEEIVYRNGMAGGPAMITNLCQDQIRNDLVMTLFDMAFNDGRHICVLSDRSEHVTYLYDRIRRTYPQESNVGRFEAGMSVDEILATCNNRIIVGTYTFINEALDIPRTDCVLMASPTLKDVKQGVGRGLRPHPDKKRPWIIDILDPFSMFRGLAGKRRKVYASLGMKITTLTPTLMPDGSWNVELIH